MNKKQAIFIREMLRFERYSKTNAAEAARIAGYAHPDKAGANLMKNKGIRAILEGQLDKMLAADRRNIKRYILDELCTIVFAQLGDYLDDNGNIKISKIKEVNPGAVKEYRVDVKTGAITIKLQDKRGHMDLLAKMLGFDLHDIEGDDDTEKDGDKMFYDAINEHLPPDKRVRVQA